MAFIILMIDGIGLASAGPHNPVADGLPQLQRALRASLTDALHIDQQEVWAGPIDATLGVAGLPQSGSGHAAIWGGFNAAMFNGRHQPSYPTVAMRKRLAEHNVFKVARQHGYRVAWANAYLPGYKEAIERRRLRHTAGTWSALQAGLPLRGIDELLDGNAVTWDITHWLAHTRPGAHRLPVISPYQAGARLASLTYSFDLVAFETYLPDLAAHRRLDRSVEEILPLVDELITGVLAHLAANDTLVVTSDHGNSEDARSRVHTRNPVPLLVFGPAVPYFREVRAIDQIAAAILAGLIEGRL
jgi:2,3-bisphosphoglycerate-independent phosphoglycerate mutase